MTSIYGDFINLNSSKKLLITTIILIMFFTGVFFRYKPIESLPTIDWLVIVQLLIALIGVSLSVLLLLNKQIFFGIGAKTLLVYILLTAVSSIFSKYPYTVFGYWILLAGISLLTISLVSRTQTVDDFLKLEKLYFVSIALIVLINSVAACLLSDLDPTIDGGFRFGMVSVHASALAFLALYTLCLSSVGREFLPKFFLCLIRMILLAIIIFSRTRVPILLCIVVGIMGFMLSRKEMKYPWIIITCVVGTIITFYALTLFFELPLVMDSFIVLNRGDLGSIGTLTGRTDIWPHAIERATESWLRFIFGHGYCVTKLVINENTRLDHFFSHSHNAFIEHLVGMGILGIVSFLILMLYSTKWIFDFKRLCRQFSMQFTIRAATIMIVFYASSLTEVPMGAKVSPLMAIIIFYILVLDRSRFLSKDYKFY